MGIDARGQSLLLPLHTARRSRTYHSYGGEQVLRLEPTSSPTLASGQSVAIVAIALSFLIDSSSGSDDYDYAHV